LRERADQPFEQRIVTFWIDVQWVILLTCQAE